MHVVALAAHVVLDALGQQGLLEDLVLQLWRELLVPLQPHLLDGVLERGGDDLVTPCSEHAVFVVAVLAL